MKDFKRIDDWVKYVPEYDGNRNDKNPITVEIKPLTVREAKQSAQDITAERVKGFRGRFKTNQAQISQRIFLSNVRNINNISYGGAPITTPEELLDTHLVELVGEIEEAINDISILNEGDIKNLKSQSAGTTDGASSGTASTARRNPAENKPETAVESTET